MNLPSGNITFLFTDIEGSTKLAQEFNIKYQDSLKKHNSILHNIVESNNGFVFKTIGDSFCCAFQNAEDAVNAAVKTQLELFSSEWGDVEIKARMGIHTGISEWNGNDYMGYVTLARAQRIMSAAYGGQILISNDAHNNIEGKILNNISFRDLGERRLKDLVEPMKLFQIISNDIPSDFPALKTLDARPNNLPVQLTSFIGREEEIKSVKDLMEQTHLLTLTGSGGAGKTRLAMQVAADVIDNFTNGVWFVELASVTKSSLLSKEILKVLGVKEEPNKDLEDTLCEYLSEKEMLIILDNCEHLIKSCAELAEKLLRRSSGLKIIATSREALRCEGEMTCRVLSLEVPDPEEENSPENLSQYESVRLFIERALAVNSAFRVNNNNAPALAQICYHLDGIPLALELAAARTKILTVEKICERLNDRFRLLTGGKRTAMPRQQTLKALIDWSYDLLSEEEKILWKRISVFSGGWTLEAAEEICIDEKLNKKEILELLYQLTEKSIINFDSEKDRYRILETLKQYGQEKLMDGKETDIISSKHLHYFMKFSETGEVKLKGPEEKIWLDKLEADHINIQSAIDWSLKGGDRNEGARLAAASQIFWSIRGHFSTGSRLLESVLADPQELNNKILGNVKSRMGSQLVYLCEFEKAKTYLEEALILLRAAGDTKGIADTLNMLGNIMSYLGDYEQAKKLFEENIIIGQKTEDKTISAVALNNLGNLEYALGNYEQARDLYERSLTLRRESGNKQGLAIAYYNLGNILMDQGKYEESRKFFEESLAVSREIGEKRMMAGSLNCLGGIASVLEGYEKARKLIEESLKLNREIGEKRNIARSLSFLGRLEQNNENYEEARNIFNETLSLTRHIREKSGIAFALDNLGNVSYLQEDYNQARKFYEESLLIKRELGEKREIAISLNNLGNVLYSLGELEQARKSYLESLEIKIEACYMNSIPFTLVGFAGVFAANDPSRSLKLLGAVRAGLKATKSVFDKFEQKLQQQVLSELREKVSSEDYMKYLEEGEKLSLEQAGDLAMNNEQ